MTVDMTPTLQTLRFSTFDNICLVALYCNFFIDLTGHYATFSHGHLVLPAHSLVFLHTLNFSLL